MKHLKLNNEEKTQKLTTKARRALIKTASHDWECARDAAGQAVKLEIVAINRLRNCGLKLREASGREQADFQFFHNCNGSLPKDMSFAALKFCVHLSRNFEKPIETIDEARSARQMLFEAFGHSKSPKRLGDQQAHEENPWNDFVSIASSFTSLFSKLETDAMEDWNADKLQTFIKQTDPIVEQNSKAKSLL